MEKRSIFDRLALAIVVFVAFVQAAQQALMDAPNITSAAPLRLTGDWNYVPLSLLILGGLFWVVGRLPSPQKSTIKAEFGVTVAKVENAPKAATDAEPTPETPASRENRTFLDPTIRPEHILSSFSGKTAHQGSKLAAPYLGKWMKIRGRLADLRSGFRDTFSIDLTNEEDAFFIVYHWAQFDFKGQQWLEKLELISVGQEIVFVGQIRSVSERFISLAECELLPREEWADATALGYKTEQSATPKTKRAKPSPRSRSTKSS